MEIAPLTLVNSVWEDAISVLTSKDASTVILASTIQPITVALTVASHRSA